MHSENVALAVSVVTVNHSILYSTKIISIEVLVILWMNALVVDFKTIFNTRGTEVKLNCQIEIDSWRDSRGTN